MLVCPCLLSRTTGQRQDVVLIPCHSCGRALGPHGDKEHHLKPPDPDPNITPPPLTTPAMPRMEFTDQVGGDLSRASTPSID